MFIGLAGQPQVGTRAGAGATLVVPSPGPGQWTLAPVKIFRHARARVPKL
jgi:hypothetical protein